MSMNINTNETARKDRTYEDAINSLNTLQSNFSVLAAIRASGRPSEPQSKSEMHEWLRRIGYTATESFKNLKIVHVAGTKGKGSTCAFVSSILSQYAESRNKKVGMNTSPHLRSARERIRINGVPLSESLFAKYFFEVWDRVEDSVEREGLDKHKKPAYFGFLTLVAFHTFLREGVESAVVEVGIGGEYDSTNVISKPTATGISSLGIDHVFILGKTIEEIAWHKAGIIKYEVPAFTAPQCDEAIAVIRKRADEKLAPLKVIGVHPEIESGVVKLGLEGEFQKVNASLAVALAASHMKALGVEFDISPESVLPKEFKQGLQNVKWPGRCQVIDEGCVQWCLDGAHTTESLDAAGKWFGQHAPKQNRVLIFNQQNRDAPEKLLSALARSLKASFKEQTPMFQHVIFCTNNKKLVTKPDNINLNIDMEAVNTLTVQKALQKAWQDIDIHAETHIFETVDQAVDFARGLDLIDGLQWKVLITGSLHLIGGILGVIDPKVE